jgi:hypothetical protein
MQANCEYLTKQTALHYSLIPEQNPSGEANNLLSYSHFPPFIDPKSPLSAGL